MPKDVPKRPIRLHELPTEESSVRSPCVSICVYDSKDDYCTGCFRDADDVSDWWRMNDAEKREALKRCKKNKKRDQEGPA